MGLRWAKATEPPHLGQTLLLRGITAVVAHAFTLSGRAPASAGPRRLAPLRVRSALGVSVGEQQCHYCDTEQNKTDRAHGSSLGPSFRSDLQYQNGIVCAASANKASFRIGLE